MLRDPAPALPTHRHSDPETSLLLTAGAHRRKPTSPCSFAAAARAPAAVHSR
jgi:hypothetical protein